MKILTNPRAEEEKEDEGEEEEEGRRGGNRKKKEIRKEHKLISWFSAWTDWKLRKQKIDFVSDSNFRSTGEIITY